MDCIGSHEAPDVLWGADEIGRTIGKPIRATFHLLEAGHLPARKIGGRWCASRRKLLEALIGDDEDRLDAARSSPMMTCVNSSPACPTPASTEAVEAVR